MIPDHYRIEEALNAVTTWEDREWSFQGFGMFRTYLDPLKVWRVNVWDPRTAVPGVSTIHDHPWHFKSWVLAGMFQNVRYAYHPHGDLYSWSVIETGEGGGPDGESGVMPLLRLPVETYHPRAVYRQHNREIHESMPTAGCVTLNKRERVDDGEHARVFWPHGTEWVDAEPRPATLAEMADTMKIAKYMVGYSG